jgi:hypothetical protein
MKYLKLFENKYTERNTDETVDATTLDSMPLRSPVYQKGEIIIWSDFPRGQENVVDYDFAERLLRRVGLKLIGEPYDNGFLVKCEPGKEEETAKMVIDKYPDFFTNYEREDIRMPFISNKVEKISDKVADIESFFESSIKKNVNITKYNNYIDDIISDLNKLKIK